MEKLHQIKTNIPNSLTMLSICFAWLAIANTSTQIYLTTFFALAGFMTDTFDGQTARFLKVASPLGRQLDSFADLILYIMWPAQVYFIYFAMVDLISMLIQMVFICSGVYRLARFNQIGYVSRGKVTGYPGLPVVFSHLIVILGLVGQQWGLTSPAVLNMLILLHSYLMVQMFPFPRLNTGFIILILVLGMIITLGMNFS